jgi:hypothetical protein
MQEPFVSQLYKIVALPFLFVMSVTGKEGMKTGTKLPSRASVVRAGVTSFILLSFCQNAAEIWCCLGLSL